MDKKELRKKVLAERSKFSKNYISEASNKIFNQIRNMEVYKKSNTVMIYVSYENEIDTHDFINEMIREGKRVVTPICDFSDRSMILAVTNSFPEGFEMTKFGILEMPIEGAVAVTEEEVDLIITPGVAFTRDGRRMGYGGGFYDRLLAKKRAETLTVCPCYEEFLLEDIPTGKYDLPVDIIVTPNETIYAG
ncbi:5-formyltetrahydrofolate cyclo-ligase [Alkalibacter mobilis]|uniref:5-formyltetrahydrofolate cyclo-ligase n=1 Tax=Alkalibacter mobilis TaxID=2787712 RepID=UPI00189E9FB0|nr:5-formyltetrahydrofolate cyclo-ligase [Alkalibacter mobilis]MBF7096540.1 5-formyltetrahydrofolate cyclo-ligase [Alkalibacter mobilis]